MRSSAVSAAAAASSLAWTAVRNWLTTCLLSSGVKAAQSPAAGVASCAAENNGPAAMNEPKSVATRMKTRIPDRRIDHPLLRANTDDTRGARTQRFQTPSHRYRIIGFVARSHPTACQATQTRALLRQGIAGTRNPGRKLPPNGREAKFSTSIACNGFVNKMSSISSVGR